MRSSRAVVLPLLDTDLPSGPLVLLDAMAHGKAVIVSDVGGARDYVQPGVDALVVPPGDAGALASAVQRVAEDPRLAEQLGQAAVESARQFTAPRFWAGVLGVTASTP